MVHEIITYIIRRGIILVVVCCDLAAKNNSLRISYVIAQWEIEAHAKIYFSQQLFV